MFQWNSASQNIIDIILLSDRTIQMLKCLCVSELIPSGGQH